MSDASKAGGLTLNLGCGSDTRRDAVNVDKYPGVGVDMVLDLEKTPWPWRTASVDRIFALRVLNHLPHWEDAFLECARILRPLGEIVVNVHYGLGPVLFVPYHWRVFDEHTFDLFCDNAMMKTCVPFVKTNYATATTLERSTPYFSMLDLVRLHETYPFVWHLAQRFGPRVYRWPLGRTSSLLIVFRRNEREYRER